MEDEICKGAKMKEVYMHNGGKEGKHGQERRPSMLQSACKKSLNEGKICLNKGKMCSKSQKK